jgi:uncharacterized GH25 family protein
MRLLLLALLCGVVTATTARAHYHMLLPDRHSVKAGDKVVVTYQFGHPFEHELFDTEKPVKALAFDPDQKSVNLLPSFEKVEVPAHEEKKVAAYRFTFQPVARGDYTLVVESPPIWVADEKHFFHDTCRLTIHVDTQKGWDLFAAERGQFSITPLTRPYGLRPGMVFQARVRAPGVGVTASHLVEIERYNSIAPKALPPDEHITFAVKTDSGGVATCTLPDAGWWAITAIRQLGPKLEPATKEHDGKHYPVIDRATLWVPVDDKIPLKPAE